MKKLIGALLTAVGGMNLATAALADDTVSKDWSYDLAPYQRLTVSAEHTDVQISQSQQDKIYLVLEQKVISGDPQTCLLDIRAVVRENELKIATDWPYGGDKNHCKVKRTLKIALDERAIRRFDLKLEHGDLDVASLGVKTQQFAVEHGAIKAGTFTGTTTSLNARHTDVKIDKVEVANFNLDGSHGDMAVATLQSDTLSGRWRHGDIQFANVNTKTVDLDHAHGGVVLAEHRGTKLSIHNEHGLIKAAKSDAVAVELANSHGDISYAGTSDQINVKSSHGDVKLIQKNSEFKQVFGRTSHGDINVKVPAASVCDYRIGKESKIDRDVVRQSGDCSKGGEISLAGRSGGQSISAI
ncbi:DUF4097 family beta strand repeat-containing protein [Teredinibacter turnerae]|uniref:DUF4097 family beta strand repeat-containing protein n=1 Tax=Teredinibacter turnerae TaxID=2426 RepID=UPI0005F89567|nr:DUF4097 family beta strand repeat-containing protein [Teredinibacter turnerae]